MTAGREHQRCFVPKNDVMFAECLQTLEPRLPKACKTRRNRLAFFHVNHVELLICSVHMLLSSTEERPFVSRSAVNLRHKLDLRPHTDFCSVPCGHVPPAGYLLSP